MDRIPENWNNLCPERDREQHAIRCNSINCYEKYVELEYEGPDGPYVMTIEEWLGPRI
jgi:hypothetical protein